MSDDIPSDLTFEQAYAQLEEIVAQLESGDLSLDESVALYERGQKLARRCGEMLDSAELRVQQLTGDGELRPLDR
jgi:exodeoxyribonuclease VII small subunit